MYIRLLVVGGSWASEFQNKQTGGGGCITNTTNTIRNQDDVPAIAGIQMLVGRKTSG